MTLVEKAKQTSMAISESFYNIERVPVDLDFLKELCQAVVEAADLIGIQPDVWDEQWLSKYAEEEKGNK